MPHFEAPDRRGRGRLSCMAAGLGFVMVLLLLPPLSRAASRAATPAVTALHPAHHDQTAALTAT